jgi:hypothetical protein
MSGSFSNSMFCLGVGIVGVHAEGGKGMAVSHIFFLPLISSIPLHSDCSFLVFPDMIAMI